jgi:hypothetical protein
MVSSRCQGIKCPGSRPFKRRWETKGEILGGLSALAANLCPFSGCRELAGFTEDFGEPVGEAVEATARSAVW